MALCKLGDELATLSGNALRDSEEVVAEDSVRDAAEYLHRNFGFSIGRETVRVHRAKLCACYTLRDAVSPGEEAQRLAVERTSLRDPETPAGVRERLSVASVASEPTYRVKSKWQAANGEDRYSYEAVYDTAQHVTYDELAEIVKQYTSSTTPLMDAGNTGAYVVPVGDLQLGKPDGDGTAGTVARFCEKTLAARDRMLRLGGYSTVVLPWLGDCIEGMVSQGGRLQLDIGVSEQLRLYRRLMLFQIETFAPHCTTLVVPVIPGNHDETRRDVATSSTDSWAIEGGAAVADAIKLNPEAFGHVQFVFPPRNELTFAIDVAGTRLGFAHGHQCGRDIPKWWSGQSFGKLAVGDADLLLTAHYHHLKMVGCGSNRTWIQTPALDGGSTWFRETNGDNVSAGMVSFVVENGAWRDLTVH
jgi:hypothetical protein